MSSPLSCPNRCSTKSEMPPCLYLPQSVHQEERDFTESVHLLREDGKYHNHVLKKKNKKRLHQAIISSCLLENEFPIHFLRKSKLQTINHSYLIPSTSTWFSFTLFFFPPISMNVFSPTQFLTLVLTYFCILFTHYFLFIHFFVHNPQKFPCRGLLPQYWKASDLIKDGDAMGHWSKWAVSWEALNWAPWRHDFGWSVPWNPQTGHILYWCFWFFLFTKQGNTWSVLQRWINGTMNTMDVSGFSYSPSRGIHIHFTKVNQWTIEYNGQIMFALSLK